jgi:hypothetical protein
MQQQGATKVATVVDAVAGAETTPINVDMINNVSTSIVAMSNMEMINMVATTLVAMDVATVVMVSGIAHKNNSMVATSLPIRCVEKLATLPYTAGRGLRKTIVVHRNLLALLLATMELIQTSGTNHNYRRNKNLVCGTNQDYM